MSKHYLDPRSKIFFLNSNRPLAEKITDTAGVELGKCFAIQSSDGEVQVNTEESIRGAHAYVIQSTSSSANDSLMELLIMIDALKRVSAKAVDVVMPHYGYVRQDRKARTRGPTTAKLVANMIEKAGITRMLTLNLHAVQIQGLSGTPADHLMGVPLIADYFIEHGIQGDDVVVVSPDHGGATRARKLTEFLKAPIVIIDKRRPKANVVEIMNVIGHVEGKTRVSINDVIDTAGIIFLAANTLEEAGTKDVYVSRTYPALSGPALQRIEDSAVKCLTVTDSIYLSDDRKIAKADEVSVGELTGGAIKRIHENKSVSSLFEIKNK